MLVTFHLALLAQVATVQIHIGRVVLDMIPEARHDSRRADSQVGASDPRRDGESYDESPTSRSESRHPRTSSPRRSSRPASRPLMVTNQSEVPDVVMGGIQVCLSDCLKNRLFTLLHLQRLLRHLTMK